MDRAFSPMAGKFIGSCRRFIYALAQCFFISCCLSGSANGMYVKLVFKRLTRSAVYLCTGAVFFRSPSCVLRHFTRSGVFFPPFWVIMPGRETSKICTWSLTPGPPISMLISALQQKYIYVAADKIDFVGCQAFLNNIQIGVRGGKQ